MSIAPFTPKAIRLPGNINKLADDFLRQCQARNLSLHTLAAYRNDLQQFAGYMQQRCVEHVQQVGEGLLYDWMAALQEGEGNSPRTVARKLETVRSLYRMAGAKGLVAMPTAAQLVHAPKFDNAPPIAPDIEKLKTFICSLPGDTALQLRDRAMFWLLLSSALRIGGLCSLDVYNPEGKNKWCVLPNGLVRYHYKGGHTETTVADDVALGFIREWEAVRNKLVRSHTDGALFISQQGRRMTRHTAHYAFKAASKNAGMPDLHLHLLRHSRAADVIASAGLDAARALLGHKLKSTTMDMYGDVGKQSALAQVQLRAPMAVEKKQCG